MSNNKILKIDISMATFVKIVAIFAIVVFAYLVREILLALAVAVIIASAVNPLANFFERRKIHRALSILLVYLLIIAIIALVVFLVVPPVAGEVQQLTNNLPDYLDSASSKFDRLQEVIEKYDLIRTLSDNLGRLSEHLGNLTTNAISSTVSFFGGLISILIIFVLSFYLVVDERRIKRFFSFLIPKKHRPQIRELVNKSQGKIGAWFRGQVFLSLIIFLVTWVALSLAGVKYAMTLALIAGILEIIPIIGPIIAAIPAVLVALSQGWWLGLIVLLIYIVVQQLENHILVPKVMEKAVGISPVLVILGVLAGAKLGGILGMFIAVPVIAGLSVWVWGWIEMKNKRDSRDSLRVVSERKKKRKGK